MGSDPRAVLSTLKSMFRQPALDTVPGGASPRTAISEALAGTFLNMVELIHPNLVLEIGAHDASFSCSIKKRLPESEVVAFEANPYVFSLFSETARLKSSHIRYVLSAVSDINGEVELIIPTSVAGSKKPLHNMMGSLNRLRHPKIEDETISVASVTIDSFLGDISDRSLAIWMDVEGAVDKVLAGAAATMPQAQVILCEVEDVPLWQGQATDNEIVTRFQQWDLVPVLCDCQTKLQYNLIFVKSYLLENADIATLINEFPGHSERLLSVRG